MLRLLTKVQSVFCFSFSNILFGVMNNTASNLNNHGFLWEKIEKWELSKASEPFISSFRPFSSFLLLSWARY